MSKYNFTLDKIEVRSVTENNEPQYIVRAYAAVPNDVHIYKTQKGRNGYKSFKSLFTENAIQSMYKQALNKKVFVDVEHQLAANVNIRSLLDSLNAEAMRRGLDVSTYTHQILDYLKVSEIPFAKVSHLEIDDKGLLVEMRLNKNFREVDTTHQKYFDAVWGSLKDGFINGASVNFGNPKVIQRMINDELVESIDDQELYGISLTGGAAIHNSNIIEVAIRSMIETRTGERMENENTNIDLQKQLEQAREQLKAMQDKEQKALADRLAAEREEQKKTLESLKQAQEEMKKKMEESTITRKGVVDTPKTPTPDYMAEELERKRIRDLLTEKVKNKEIHLGHLIQLQHEFKGTSTLSPEAQALLGKSANDFVIHTKA